MSELEQTSKLLPVDDDVVVNLPEGTVIEKISDSQLVEILGRNKLVSELLCSRIEVAVAKR